MAFAPAEAFWLVPVCVAGLFMLLDGRRALSAGVLGLSFGIGWFGAGMWWIYSGLVRFTEAGAPFSGLLTAALILYLSLFPAAACTGIALIKAPRGPLSWCVTASIFTLCEWLRATLFSGFPWLQLGDAQAGSVLGALAPLVGGLGITWISTLLACLLADLLTGRRNWLAMAATCLTLGITMTVASGVSWTHPAGQLSLRLVQGNLPQFEKFTPEGADEAVRVYSSLAAGTPARLTVFPEASLPFDWSGLPTPVLASWKELSTEQQSTLLIGSFARPEISHGGDVPNNSALALSPGSESPGYDYRYDKQHLVPFGEQAVPAADWISRRLSIHYSQLQPGASAPEPLRVGDARVAISICFEDLFGTQTADKARTAQLLVNLSNFSWFDGSYGAAQHFQVGRMRARETGRWFAQSANSGVTGIADQNGNVRAALPPEVRGVLDVEATLLQGETPFTRNGNVPLLVMCAIFVGWTVVRTRYVQVPGSTPRRQIKLR